MDPILETIDEALKRKGLSDAAASKLAVGHPSLIKNLRMPRSGEKRYNFPALEKLAEILDLELYFGPPRETEIPPETEVDGECFATVARYDARAAAGGGFVNFDDEPIDHLAFSKKWLQQNGILAGSCSLINAVGESMEPSIYDGDLIMIDHRKKQIRNRKVYVYNDPEHGTRIKRLEVIPNFGVAIHSDNEDADRFPTEYHIGSKANAILQNIIGQVVWSGHKWG